MFHKKGLITVNAADIEEDKLMDIALGAGAEDMQNTGTVMKLPVNLPPLSRSKKLSNRQKIPMQVAELSMMPRTTVPVNDAETARKILALMESFEDHDDVQNVYANFDIPDEMMSKIA